ncbi:hypothetical protein GCM10009624_08250 [Gordonia sinesedis]
MLIAAALAAGAVGAVTVPGPAGAAPAAPAPTADRPPVGAPIDTVAGEYSYLATREMTQRAATMKAPEAIASFPVPAQYRPANLAMAAQFDIALQSALAEPGGCLQIVVDPRSKTGALFDYGFVPVARQYCP